MEVGRAFDHNRHMSDNYALNSISSVLRRNTHNKQTCMSIFVCLVRSRVYVRLMFSPCYLANRMLWVLLKHFISIDNQCKLFLTHNWILFPILFTSKCYILWRSRKTDPYCFEEILFYYVHILPHKRMTNLHASQRVFDILISENNWKFGTKISYFSSSRVVLVFL